jgi:hypothetical protein
MPIGGDEYIVRRRRFEVTVGRDNEELHNFYSYLML